MVSNMVQSMANPTRGGGSPKTGQEVVHEGQLHCQGVHSPVVGEAPAPLEAMQQAMFGGGDAPLFGDGVGASELGETEGASL